MTDLRDGRDDVHFARINVPVDGPTPFEADWKPVPHAMSLDCWCKPTIEPFNGATGRYPLVIMHREKDQ